MTLQPTLKAPFPYYGGKARVAAEVWRRFGDVANYIEPFFGSGAVLLGAPWPAERTETVNDYDALLSNFWRALAADPEAVARYADWPVNEVDLHARHRWLVNRRAWVEELMGDPDAYDAKAAGWWVWGISQWIGSGWCPPADVAGVGDLTRRLPHVSDGGMGVHRAASGGLLAYFAALAERLRRVRVCCGDWSRVLGPSVTWRQGVTGIFLDPPYAQDGRANVYAYEHQVFEAVRAWAIDSGDNPLLRIALCGYDGYDFEMPATWSIYRWKAAGGYGSQSNGRGRENAGREMIAFSPHCLHVEQGRLW